MSAERRDASVAVPVQVISAATENIRCLELHTGQVVFEFWTDGARVARIDATAYEAALAAARAEMQYEQVPTEARFETRERLDG